MESEYAEQLHLALQARRSIVPDSTICAITVSDSGEHVDSCGTAGTSAFYEIGSLTKILLGILVCDLAASEAVRIDESIEPFIRKTAKPEFRSISIRELVTHTSGLPRLPDNLTPADTSDPYADYTEDDLERFLATSSAGWILEGRGHFNYSNLGAGLLGYILERATQQRLDELLRKRIFEPLDMDETFISRANRTAPAGRTADGVIAAPWTFSALAGCGGVVTTPRDLHRLLRALALKQSNIDDPISASFRTLATVDGQHIGAFWFKCGSDLLWHNGRTYGYASALAVDVAARRGAAIVWNVSYCVDDLALFGTNPAMFSPKSLPIETFVAHEDMLRHVGQYRDTGATFHILLIEGRLIYEIPNQKRLVLYAASRMRFFSRTEEFELEFDGDCSQSQIVHEYSAGQYVATAHRIDDESALSA